MPSRQTGAAKTTADHQSGAGDPPRRDSAVRIGNSLLGLQQALGNRAVLHMLGAQRVQTKLRIGPPGDVFEQEADRVAHSVVSTSRTGMTEATGSLHPAPAGGIQRKCAQCEQEEEETIRRSPQEGADATTEAAPAPEAASPVAETTPETPAPESTPAPGEQTPAEPAAEAKAGATLLVEDDAEQVGPGQMHKSEFLAALSEAVCATANEAMASTGQTTENCPWMGYWFDQAAQKDAAYVEKALRKYAPETAGASTAQEIIPLVAARVRRSVDVWVTTGEITGVPEGVSTDVPGAQAPQAGGQPASGGLMFKARPGGARQVSDPQAIRNQLGPGRSLSGGVRSRMESAFGLSFSKVRIHNDASAGALSDQLNARAFTVGEHVAFGPGEYRPGSLVGDALLAHELAHVVQQGGATADSAPMMKGDGEYNALEQDADRSAVGAVASLWARGKGRLADISDKVTPQFRSGLELHRCSKKGGLSKGTIAGGVTGLTMAVTATYSECGACADGLEAIQVFWGTRRTDGVQVGTHQTVFPPLAATYDSFVDGGKNSPGGAVYSGDHPYYIGRADLPASYGYTAGQGSAGSVSGCIVNVSDAPAAATLHDQAFFETAIVCLNYQGKGKDKLLDAFKWGFISLGTTYKPSPTSSQTSGLETTSSPSGKFEETLKADYSGYSHD